MRNISKNTKEYSRSDIEAIGAARDKSLLLCNASVMDIIAELSARQTTCIFAARHENSLAVQFMGSKPDQARILLHINEVFQNHLLDIGDAGDDDLGKVALGGLRTGADWVADEL